MTTILTYPVVEWDAALIKKYNYSGPRYTSYPTALEFNTNFSQTEFIQAATANPKRPLSLYIHIPFCHKLCYFCGCNKIITRQTDKVVHYLQRLEKEISYRSTYFVQRAVTQLHLGGGTPTFLTNEQISHLITQLKQHFNFSPTAELSIEIDPREISLMTITELATLGFNRLSMGIQDFDKRVQRLINREQDENFIHQLIIQARKNQFTSINLDLIYGLPTQTVDSFLTTLDKVIALDPDRLSIFNYAHLPSRFAAQRKIKENDLPDPEMKLTILQRTIQKLTAANYQFIGMDHFAKPNNELAIAQDRGELHRNFQGYTTQGANDLLGLGVSAISMIGNTYSQNQKELSGYMKDVDDHNHALWKGLIMTADDSIRAEVIKQLICHFQLNKNAISSRYAIAFNEYFAEDLALLRPLIQDNLITETANSLQVTPKGRLLIRNICMCFDRYFRNIARQQQFSRVI